jgi:hypothetical protein
MSEGIKHEVVLDWLAGHLAKKGASESTGQSTLEIHWKDGRIKDVYIISRSKIES